MQLVEMADLTFPTPAARRAPARMPRTRPAVSIVLPVHNGEAFLADALESVIAQSFADFELIAVDDCSTDGSPAILADHAARDPRVRVITLETNAKLPGALNTGFAQARANWLSWTSDDNILHPAMLETLLAERERHPEADIFYAGYRLINADGQATGQGCALPCDQLIERNVVGCCFLYRREVHEKLGGYDEALFGVEDYDFWLRAARAGFRLQPVDAQLYDYRRHERSLTDRRWYEIRDGVTHILEREIELCDDPGTRARGWLALFTGNPYTPSPRFVLEALREHPTTVIARWRDLLVWAWRALAWRIK